MGRMRVVYLTFIWRDLTFLLFLKGRFLPKKRAFSVLHRDKDCQYPLAAIIFLESPSQVWQST